MRLDRRLLGACGAMLLAAGAATPVLAHGAAVATPTHGGRTTHAAPAANTRPPFLGDPRFCPKGLLPLGPAAVGRGALAALRAEPASERPRIVSAALARNGSARGQIVRHSCGEPVWRRTVVVWIDMRAHHPSASLSERVSYVGRTRDGLAVWGLAH